LSATGALGDPRRSATSRRRFDAADLRLLEHLRTLSDLGLPDAVIASVVSGTFAHLDALGRHNQEVLFGAAGAWSTEERERFREQLPQNMDQLRDAVAWMVRILQLRTAQQLLVSASELRSAADAAPRSRKRGRP
jgi:DNA-binding transcriptional MerR regulator